MTIIYGDYVMSVKLNCRVKKAVRIILFLLMVLLVLYLFFMLLSIIGIDKKENIQMLSGEGLIALIGGIITISVVINDAVFKLKPKKKIPAFVFLIIIILFSVVYDLGVEQIFNKHGYSECKHFIRKDLSSIFVKNKNNCALDRTRWW